MRHGFFTIYLLIMTLMVERLSISIHHWLTTFPDLWVSLPFLGMFFCQSLQGCATISLWFWRQLSLVNYFFPQLLSRTAQNPPRWCRSIPLISWSGSGSLILPGRTFRLLLYWVQCSPVPCARTSRNCISPPWTRRDCLYFSGKIPCWINTSVQESISPLSN